MRKRKTKQLTSWQYDSKFEQELVEGVMQGIDYHNTTINYTVHHESKYTPDFVINKDQVTYYIEAKGRFHDRNEANKYIYIRNSLKEHEELIFLFQKPFNPFPGAQRRKNGTRMTHAEWANKNGFLWYDVLSIRELVW